MQFGERVRELRLATSLAPRDLGAMVEVGFSHLSKIENQRLSFGEYPSEVLIHKLATALAADVDGLLILAEKVPKGIRRRLQERPEAFRKIAELDDEALDRLLESLGKRYGSHAT